MAAHQWDNAGYNGIVEGENPDEGNNAVVDDGAENEIILDGPTMTTLLPVQVTHNGEGYGVPEGGPQNGYTFAGLAEPLPVMRHEAAQNGRAINGLAAANRQPLYVPFNEWITSSEAPVTDLLYCVGRRGFDEQQALAEQQAFAEQQALAEQEAQERQERQPARKKHKSHKKHRRGSNN